MYYSLSIFLLTKHCCYKHSYTCFLVHSSLGFQEWNSGSGLTVYQNMYIFQIKQILPSCFLQWLIQFALPHSASEFSFHHHHNTWCHQIFYSVYWLLNISLMLLYIFFLFLIWCYINLPMSGQQIELKRSRVTCSRSCSQKTFDPGFDDSSANTKASAYSSAPPYLGLMALIVTESTQ